MTLRWMAVLGLPLAITMVPGEARAATANCDNVDGACEVSNDMSDSIVCECADGSGVAGGGGNEWAGLSEDELEVVCFEQLEAFCGEVPPPPGIPCENENGSCWIDNEPDSLTCECASGDGGGFGGGNEWDGLDDDQLADECLVQLDLFCVPGEPEWDCENDLGGCSISTEGDVFVSCGCEGGGGGGGPGDPEWAELGEKELAEVCFEQITEFCGGPPPTTSESSESGAVTTEATTTETTASESGTETGATGTGTTGDTDPGTTGDTDPGTTGDTDPGTTGASMTGNDEDSDSLTGATMSGTVSATGSEESGETSSTDSAGSSDDGSGCSCEVDGGDRSGLLGLGMLALFGLRTRRRRRAG